MDAGGRVRAAAVCVHPGVELGFFFSLPLVESTGETCKNKGRRNCLIGFGLTALGLIHGSLGNNLIFLHRVGVKRVISALLVFLNERMREIFKRR